MVTGSVGSNRTDSPVAQLLYSMVIEISCVEVWREISNYIDKTTDPGTTYSRMEAHFQGVQALLCRP